MDENRRLRAELYSSLDMLRTKWAQVQKDLDFLQECVLITTEDLKEKVEEEIQRLQKNAENAKVIEKSILEILESGGSEEAIQKAERLYKQLNEGK